MKPVLAFAAAATLTLAGASAHAGVLFNNFGPGDTFEEGTGWTVSTAATPAVGEANTPGFEFTAADSGSVDQIDIAMMQVQGAAGDVQVKLYTGGFGALLGTWTLSNLPTFGNSGVAPVSISGITGINLVGGSSYVLQAVATGGAYGVWGWNATNDLAPWFDGTAPKGENVTGAFRITSGDSVVPEPGAWALMILGFSVVGGALRQRRLQAA